MSLRDGVDNAIRDLVDVEIAQNPELQDAFDGVDAHMQGYRADAERLLAETAALKAALCEACGIATTHLPEDRQRILELHRLGLAK